MHKDKDALLNLLTNLANTYYDLDQALEQYEEAHNLNVRLQKRDVEARLLGRLAAVNADLGNIEQSNRYARMAEVLALVGYQNLALDGARIAFARPGMQITLDGIAKGYIVDAGVAALQARGFENVMVEAGGDLMAAGEKTPRSLWQIGIQSPRFEKPGLLASFAVQNQAVATSGDYHQAFTPDLTLHHILDPLTGVSAPQLASATVLAASGAQADAMATALMVMEVEAGLALVESLPGIEAYLVTKGLEEIQSTGFQV